MSKTVELTNKLRGIASIDNLCNAASILEKILWASTFISGILFAIYFIGEMFDGNTSFVSKIDVQLSDLHYPAMTICSQGTTKYAIAERLGNYLDGNSNFIKKFPHLKDIASCIGPLTSDNCFVGNFGYPTYFKVCLKPRRRNKPVPLGCKVNFCVIFLYLSKR